MINNYYAKWEKDEVKYVKVKDYLVELHYQELFKAIYSYDVKKAHELLFDCPYSINVDIFKEVDVEIEKGRRVFKDNLLCFAVYMAAKRMSIKHHSFSSEYYQAIDVCKLLLSFWKDRQLDNEKLRIMFKNAKHEMFIEVLKDIFSDDIKYTKYWLMI